MAKKKTITTPYTLLYEADGDIYNVGPFNTEKEVYEYVRENDGQEFDVSDQHLYCLFPDHRMVEIDESDLVKADEKDEE